jgi:endonuclease YncB( thermonuclease family)
MAWAKRSRRSRDSIPRRLTRRRRVRAGVITTLLVLGLSALLDRAGLFRYPGDDWANFDHKQFLVSHVADGDTLTVRPAGGGGETRVRLVGVDAPELPGGEGGTAHHWGREAKGYLAGRAERQLVTLRLEPTQTRDKYGRLLAYVYLGADENVNLALVQDGQAYAHRDFPHSLRTQFEQAESEARKKGRGLWETVSEEQMPAWRRRWLRSRREARGGPQ